MAKLPNAHLAFVADEKLGGYLLNPTHKVGGPKLRFLEAFGFARSRPEEVRASLLDHARTSEGAVASTPYGLKYELDGDLRTPSGRTPRVRTVWLVEPDAPPRFVSLKPLGRQA
ncbi:MAG: DUF6883 domain-containing protein [Hyphomonadaceae bacterium]